MNYDQIVDARQLYASGENVSRHLNQYDDNSIVDVVELVYDCQAGSYIKYANESPEFLTDYAEEMAEIVGKYVSNPSSFLDLGCGEITTLSHLIKRISGLASSTRAVDISLSRLLCGLEYAKEHMGPGFQNLSVAAAELQHIPLAGKSIDVSISNHALEPNGGDERRILGEIFRVTRGLCILFEPNFEAASAVAQERMTSLGYVKNLSSIAENLGAEVLDIIPMKNIRNPLNPTSCFIFRPPHLENQAGPFHSDYTLPGTSYPLEEMNSGFISRETGLFFPVVKGIPILRKKAGIYANWLLHEK